MGECNTSQLCYRVTTPNWSRFHQLNLHLVEVKFCPDLSHYPFQALVQGFQVLLEIWWYVELDLLKTLQPISPNYYLNLLWGERGLSYIGSLWTIYHNNLTGCGSSWNTAKIDPFFISNSYNSVIDLGRSIYRFLTAIWAINRNPKNLIHWLYS